MVAGAKRPKTAKEQIRHSIDKLSLFESMINGCLTNTEEQYHTFSAVRSKTHILDDATVNRAIKLYQAQLKDVPLYRQQLTWWQEDPLTDAQRQRIELLLAKLLQINNQSETILTLLADIQKGTINRILEMEDGELGLAFLMGNSTARIQTGKGLLTGFSGAQLIKPVYKLYTFHQGVTLVNIEGWLSGRLCSIGTQSLCLSGSCACKPSGAGL